MNGADADLRQITFPYRILVGLGAACLAATVLVGLFLGLASAYPLTWVDPAAIRQLRPLHTLFALTWLWMAIAGGIGWFTAGRATFDRILAYLQAGTLGLFLAWGVTSLFMEQFSGREYFSWTGQVHLVLLPGLAMSLLVVLRSWSRLRKASPEAAWMILLGTLLMPLGLMEAQGYHLGLVGVDPGRDLTLQWHALDTVIAGWMLCLYGLGILALPGPGKPLRAGWLYGLAVVGILCDFGHHNYPSPQPHWIKIMSFSATMLAAISFYRHVRTARRMRSLDGLPGVLFRHIEWWTLFAVGSGVFMAVPWFNAYVHGTYVVVAHTMGSIIGVNTLLAVVLVYRLTHTEGRLREILIRAVSGSNLVLVVVLTGLGLARGILRIDQPFHEWIHVIRPAYVLIPLAALPLGISLLALATDVAGRALLPPETAPRLTAWFRRSESR